MALKSRTCFGMLTWWEATSLRVYFGCPSTPLFESCVIWQTSTTPRYECSCLCKNWSTGFNWKWLSTSSWKWKTRRVDCCWSWRLTLPRQVSSNLLPSHIKNSRLGSGPSSKPSSASLLMTRSRRLAGTNTWTALHGSSHLYASIHRNCHYTVSGKKRPVAFLL